MKQEIIFQRFYMTDGSVKISKFIAIRFTLKEKWLIFWRLLNSSYILEGYTFEEILKDGKLK